MNAPLETTGTLFGTINRSPVWAFDGAAIDSGVTSLPIESDQLICVLHQSGILHVLKDGGPFLSIEAGHILFLRNEKGGTLTFEWGGPGQSDFLVFGFETRLIQSTLRSSSSELTTELSNLVFEEGRKFNPVQTLMSKLISERIFSDLRNPPVSGKAVHLWNEGRIRDVIALCFYHAPESGEQFFCTRQKRLGQERVAKTKSYILANLDESLDLKAAARYVGCSPHYLSRTFSECEGYTILQYVRKARIEKAAELLSTGKYNVSEAAVEVGYQSLSHFSKAFQQEKGMLPSRYESNGRK
ncbi:MAG: AraC family transcriptional regulator [Verrucomicrobiales bacterium]|nr:AraC family transcriptional regulator [Verrucomicrobiales bacterium]